MTFLKNNIGVIVLYMYLICIALYPLGWELNFSIVINSLFLIGLVSFISILPKWISIISSILYIFILSLNAIFSFVYKSWIWAESILNISRTNQHEALGLKDSFFQFLLIVTLTAFIYIQGLKSLKKYNKRKTIIISTICLLYSIIIFPLQIRTLMITQMYTTIIKQPLDAAIFANQRCPILLGNIFSCYGAYKESLNINELVKHILEKQNINGIEISTRVRPSHIFIVIGESSNNSHYSLYNYPIRTTPFLDSIHESNNLIKYDAISSHPSTLASLRRVFSFSSVGNDKNAYTKYSAIEYAKKIGYQTYWISSQYQIGSDDLGLSCIYYNADNTEFINSKGSVFKLDINLIPLIENYYNENEDQVFFIHLQGSHIDYSNKFDTQDSEYYKRYETNDKTVNDYDRSIVHTDKIIKHIYNIMKNDSNSILVYFSDHGEIIGKGHGFDFDFESQYQIPFLTISESDKLLNYSDSILNTLKRNNRLNTVNTSLYLTQLMGYDISPNILEEREVMNDSVGLQSGFTLLFDDLINQ